MVKIIIHILKYGAYQVNVGWVDSMVLDILSVYILAKSNIKNKAGMFLLGLLAYVSTTVIIATLATFGFIGMPV